MNKIGQYFGEIRFELAKVTWLTRAETIKLTVMVLFVAGILGGFVGAFDFAFTKLLSLLLTR